MSNKIEIPVVLKYLGSREYINKNGEKALSYDFGLDTGFKSSGSLKAMQNPELKPNALYTCTLVVGKYYIKEQNRYRDYNYVKDAVPYKK